MTSKFSNRAPCYIIKLSTIIFLENEFNPKIFNIHKWKNVIMHLLRMSNRNETSCEVQHVSAILWSQIRLELASSTILVAINNYFIELLLYLQYLFCINKFKINITHQWGKSVIGNILKPKGMLHNVDLN